MDSKQARLLSDYFDEALSAESAAELAAMLKSDAGARRDFVRTAAIHRQLHDISAGMVDFLPPEPATLPKASGQRWLKTSRMVGLAASLLLVCYFLTVGSLLIWDRAHRSQHHAPLASADENSPAAPSTNDEGSGELPAQSTLGPTRLLRVSSGVREFKFATGATVTVQGPAEFEVVSQNGGFLRVGRLVAVVPKTASGFTIETPSATIVDRGTRFCVNVDANRSTQLHVLQGLVELTAAASTDRPPIQLRAGDARQVDFEHVAGRDLVRAIRYRGEQFARDLADADIRPLHVSGVLASSEYWDRRGAMHLVNHRGLSGDQHTDVSEYGMWHSFDGDVENVFLLFDLGRRCQLQSMKVWNYNESRLNNFRYYGAKRASVFVSDSGIGDPLSQPDAWQLMVADQTLSMATGRPDYATPDIVPLEVETRFVAMVFGDHFGPPPASNSTGHNCVGLSEVQFLGRPVRQDSATTAKGAANE